MNTSKGSITQSQDRSKQTSNSNRGRVSEKGAANAAPQILDSREEQRKQDAKKKSAPAAQIEKVQKEAVQATSQRSNPVSADSSKQRPRSRPSDKHPVKRGNSSSSNQNQNMAGGQEIKKADVNLASKIDDSGDEDGEEEYEPQFDEDEDDEDPTEKTENQQILNKSKGSVPLKPVNEEVKEMKSVDEETNKDSEEDKNAFNLGDINDLNSPAS